MIEKAASIPEKVYAVCAGVKEYGNLTPKQQARIFGKAMADVLKTAIADKAIIKFRTKIFKKPNTKVNLVVGKFKKSIDSQKQPLSSIEPIQAAQLQQNPHTEIVTADGTKIKVPENQHPLDELVHLQENVGGQNNNTLKNTVREISKDIKTESINKTIEDLIKNAKPARNTKGRTAQYELPGGFKKALEDFELLQPTQIIRDDPDMKIGILRDGRTIVARRESDYGTPTLEIQSSKNRLKFRYLSEMG